MVPRAMGLVWREDDVGALRGGFLVAVMVDEWLRSLVSFDSGRIERFILNRPSMGATLLGQRQG
jgi:hypothetical protein